MNLVTIEEAMAHCKADAADQVLVTAYGDAAEHACALAANRALFADDATLAAAIDGVPTKIRTARDAHRAALDAADLLDDEFERESAISVADTNLHNVEMSAGFDIRGMVVTPDIKVAVLLTIGHYYRNREEVITDQGANAVPLPWGAESIMFRHRRF